MSLGPFLFPRKLLAVGPFSTMKEGIEVPSFAE